MHFNKLNKILFYILIVLFILSLSCSIDFWITDITSHFPVQYALISLVLMSVYIWKKTVPLAMLAGFLFVFNISSVINWGESIHAAGQSSKSFKVYSANLNQDNRDLLKINIEVHKIDPEIVLLLEVNLEQDQQLRSIMQHYPYHIYNASFESLGFLFLSKFPIHSHNVTKLSKFGNSILEAMLEINQKPVMFYGIHAQRPSLINYIERKNQFLWLTQQIKEQSLPVIVAGDFNTTPYSTIFKKLVTVSRLKDTREGFGWQPSWPTYFPPLWIPIDHVLVTPDIQVHQRTTGPYVGSDHYPVIAELSLD